MPGINLGFIIAAIATGAVVGIALIVAAVVIVIRKRRKDAPAYPLATI
jgi:hypothetical protein